MSIDDNQVGSTLPPQPPPAPRPAVNPVRQGPDILRQEISRGTVPVNPKGVPQPYGRPPTRGYWESPQRVARYYNLIRSAPPTWKPPSWLDTAAVTEAYEYMKFRNNNAPINEWKWLPKDDPGTYFLKELAAPPNDNLLPGEYGYKYANLMSNVPVQAEIDAQKPVDWSTLPLYQQILIGALTPEAGLEGRPEWTRATAAAGQALLAAPAGAAIGTMIGNWPGGLALGLTTFAGTFYQAYTGKEIPGLNDFLEIMDAGAIFAERVIGLGKIAGKTSLSELLEILPEAYKASSLTYEVQKDDWVNRLAPIISAPLDWAYQQGWIDEPSGWTPGMEAEAGEVWQFQKGLVDPQKLIGPRDAEALLEAANRIRNGEKFDEVYMDYVDRFGFTGTLNDFVLQTALDPANLAPGLGGKAAEIVSSKLGNTRAAEAFRATQGSLLIDALPFPLQPFVSAVTGLQGAKGLTVGWRTYQDWIKMHYYPPTMYDLPSDMRKQYFKLVDHGIDAQRIHVSENKMLWTDNQGRAQEFIGSRKVMTDIPEIEQLSSFEQYVGGIDLKYGWKDLQPTVEKKSALARFFSLDPASQAHLLQNLYHTVMATLFDRAHGDPMLMAKMVRQIAGSETIKKGDPGEAIIKGPAGRAIRDSVRAGAELSGFENMVTDWLSVAGSTLPDGTRVPGRRDILLQIATALKQTPAEVLDQMEDNPDALMARIAAATGIQGTPELIKSALSVFIGDDAMIWNEQEFQVKLINSIADKQGEYMQKVYGLKPDSWVFRLAQVFKSVQSLVLLNFNPAYFFNNEVNNIATRIASGVWGYMSPRQIERFYDRLGITPARLKVGASPADEGAAYGANRIIADLKESKDAIGKANRIVGNITKKLGMFSRLSASFEKIEGANAFTIGTKQFLGRTWKRGKGFRKLHPAVEKVLNQSFPGMAEMLYAGIEGGLNMQEINDAILGDYIKPTVRASANAAAAAIFPNHPEIGMDILEKTGLLDQLEQRMTDAKTPEEVEAVFRTIHADLRSIINQKWHSDMIAAAAHARTLVEAERQPAVAELLVEYERRTASLWLNQRKQWDDLYKMRDQLKGDQWTVQVENLFEQQNTEWVEHYKTQTQVYDGIAQALQIDSQANRDYLAGLSEIANTWTEFHATARQLRSEFFRESKRRPNEEYEAYSLRGARLWNTLQDKLDELYQKHSRIEDAAQMRMDSFLALGFQQYTGWNPIRVQAWRAYIRSLRSEMVIMQRDIRRKTRNMNIPEKDAEYARFNPIYNKLIADMKRAEILGATWIRTQPASTETLQGAIDQLKQLVNDRAAETGIVIPEPSEAPDPNADMWRLEDERLYGTGQPTPPTTPPPTTPPPTTPPEGVPPAPGQPPTPPAAPAAPTGGPQISQVWRTVGQAAISAGIVDAQGDIPTEFLLNVVNAQLRAENRPVVERKNLYNVDPETFLRAIASHVQRHANDKKPIGSTAATVETIDTIANMAAKDKREAYIHQLGMLTRQEVRDRLNTITNPTPEQLDAAMHLLDRANDQYMIRRGYAPTDATRDAWYATRIKDIVQATENLMGLEQLEDDAYLMAIDRALLETIEPLGWVYPSFIAMVEPPELGTYDYPMVDTDFMNSPEGRAFYETERAKAQAKIDREYTPIKMSSRMDRLRSIAKTLHEIGTKQGITAMRMNALWEGVSDGRQDIQQMLTDFLIPTDDRPALMYQLNQAWNTMHNPYYQSVKGSTILQGDGRSIIVASKAADISTIVHEIAHIWRRDLPAKDLDVIAKLGGLKDATELRDLESKFHFGDEGDKFKEWRKLDQTPTGSRSAEMTARMNELAADPDVQDMQRYVKAEENFTRGWERYLAEGDAPTPELRSIFKKFTEWFLDIYRNLFKKNGRVQGFESGDLSVNIRAEIDGISLRDIFDRMIAGESRRTPTLDQLVKQRAEAIQNAGRNFKLSWTELTTRAKREVISDLLMPFASIEMAEQILPTLGAELFTLPNGLQMDAADLFDAVQAAKDDVTFNPFAGRQQVRIIRGTKTEAHGISNVQANYEFSFAVVDSKDVVASHRWEGNTLVTKENYPQELQPRDRDEQQYYTQINDIARLLLPKDLLFDFHSIDRGSPIVGPDGIVESGNGRVLALQFARVNYPENWNRYREDLDTYAAQYGIDPAMYADMEAPILVRVRDTQLSPGDRIAFANDANTPVAQAMNEAETARADVRFITDAMIAGLEVGENESIDAALLTKRNSEFVNAYLQQIPPNVRGGLSADGKLTPAGLERLKNAIFVKVYPDKSGDALFRIFKLYPDNNIKNVQAGMFASLPQVAKAEGLIRSGERPESLAIAADFARAMERYATIGQTGMTPAEFLASQGLFGNELTPAQMAIFELVAFRATALNIRTFLREYSNLVTNEPSSKQLGFEGLAPTEARKEELIIQAIRAIAPMVEGQITQRLTAVQPEPAQPSMLTSQPMTSNLGPAPELVAAAQPATEPATIPATEQPPAAPTEIPTERPTAPPIFKAPPLEPLPPAAPPTAPAAPLNPIEQNIADWNAVPEDQQAEILAAAQERYDSWTIKGQDNVFAEKFNHLPEGTLVMYGVKGSRSSGRVGYISYDGDIYPRSIRAFDGSSIWFAYAQDVEPLDPALSYRTDVEKAAAEAQIIEVAQLRADAKARSQATALENLRTGMTDQFISGKFVPLEYFEKFNLPFTPAINTDPGLSGMEINWTVPFLPKTIPGLQVRRVFAGLKIDGEEIAAVVRNNGDIVAFMPTGVGVQTFSGNGVPGIILGRDVTNTNYWVYQAGDEVKRFDPKTMKVIPTEPTKAPQEVDVLGAPEPEPEARARIDVGTREARFASDLADLLEDDIVMDRPKQFEEFAANHGFNLSNETELNFAYDILEGVFNLQARKVRADLDGKRATLLQRIEAMEKLEGKLTTARRTIAKMRLQQFSTPLTISEAAAFAADVRPGDVIGEPTAGTGNLVDRHFGNNKVLIRVNEIDPNRRKVLELIGYRKPTGLDLMKGEWVSDRTPYANVMITNPPWGAYSTGKYGRAVHIPVHMNDWSQRFTHLMIHRLSNGGRMVGVMPTNWLYTVDRTTRARSIKRSEYLKYLQDTYWVRAIIESPAGAYDKRATNIGSLLIVIDKMQKQPEVMIEAWGENAPKNWEEYSNLVKQLGRGGSHARAESAILDGQQPFARTDQPITTGPDASGIIDPAAVNGEPLSEPADIGKPTERATAARGTNTPDQPTQRTRAGGRVSPATEPAVPIGQQTAAPTLFDTPLPEQPTTDIFARSDTPRTDNRLPEPGRVGPEPGGINVLQTEGEKGRVSTPLVEGQPQPVQGRSEPKLFQYSEKFLLDLDTSRRAVANSRNFALYVARSPIRQGADYRPHPTPIVETKSLAGVPYPALEPEYEPSASVMRAMENRLLSVEGNLDPIWAAVQQNDKHHSGILIADDVGIGKSRTAAGYVIDRIEKGKKRILVVTKGAQNVDNLMNKVFPNVYGGTADEYGAYVTTVNDFPAERILLSGATLPEVKKGTAPIPTFGDRPAVYFIANNELLNFTDQINAINPDCIVVDEAHAFKGLDTKAAEAWYKLHKTALDNRASFMYLTATPGIDIADLQYLYGLRVWTMDGFSDWIGVITGQISPDRAKQITDEKNAVITWTRDVAEAAAKVQVERDMVPSYRGGMEPGYKIGRFVMHPTGQGDYWNLFDPNRMDANVMSENRAILVAQRANEIVNEGQTRTSYALDAATADIDKRFPMPVLSQQTQRDTGSRDAEDIGANSKAKKKWGNSGRTAFESTLSPAHSEQIMRELKLGGYYLSRDISRAGVEFEVVEYKPAPVRFKDFDRRIELYRRIYTAWKKFGAMNQGPKKAAALYGVSGDIQADAKRFLFDMRLPGIIEQTNAALKAGEKVVISLVSVSGVDEEGGTLRSAISKINTNEVRNLGEGQFTSPTEIPEALIEVEEIRDQLKDFPDMPSPIDYLRKVYGDKIGFITGATSLDERKSARKRFQANDLDVIVISGAGKTGINLHDINGKRRVHLVVGDFEWSATTFKQELGRVDRTGQKTSPKVTVLHTGSAAERKFVATIANRMKGLGAVSKGGGESTGTGALTDQFELGSAVDKIALQNFWAKLPREDKALFLDSYFEDKNIDPPIPASTIEATAKSIKKFLLGLMAIPVDDANRLYDQYLAEIENLRGETVTDADAFTMEALATGQPEQVNTAAVVGKVLRTTELADNLRLNEVEEVRNGKRSRFGVIEGVLTPNMNRVRNIVAKWQIDNSWMKWARVYDSSENRYISGLIIPPSDIQSLLGDFGRSRASMHTPQDALTDLQAGDKIKVTGENGARWTLRMGRLGGRDGQIIIEGSRMVNREALLNNGAIYNAIGSFFSLPETALDKFFHRFPIDNSPDIDTGTAGRNALAAGLQQAQPDDSPYTYNPTDAEKATVAANLQIEPEHLGRLIDMVNEGKNATPAGTTKFYPGPLGSEMSADPFTFEQRMIEAKLIDYMQSHYEEAKAEYIQISAKENKLPIELARKIVNTDLARELSPEYRADPSKMSPVVHEPSSAFVKAIGRDLFDEIPQDRPANEAKDIVLLAGGAASGKSSSSKLFPDLYDNADIVYDGMLSAIGNAIKRVESILKGHPNERIKLVFIYHPLNSAIKLMLQRGMDKGRIVTLKDIIAGHIGAIDVAMGLAEFYANEPRFEVKVVDNNHGFGNAIESDMNFLTEMQYNDIEVTVQSALEEYDVISGTGEITPKILTDVRGSYGTAEEIGSVAIRTARLNRALLERGTAERIAAGGNAVHLAKLERLRERFGGTRAEPPLAPPAAATPPAAPANPLGDIRPGSVPAPEPSGAIAQEAITEYVNPLLNRMRDNYKQNMTRQFRVNSLPEATKREIYAYLNQVDNDLSSTKLAAVRYGEQMRDFSVLNYSRRYTFDSYLNIAFPYIFWYLRSMMNWGMRAFDRPAWFAMYARLRKKQEEQERKGMPTRLRGKVRIPLPWMPEWMGGGLYVDPFKQFFPPAQFGAPLEYAAQQQNQLQRRTEQVLRDMVDQGTITQAEMEEALDTQAGSAWERAFSTAKVETEIDDTPMGLASMLMQPALWWTIPSKLASGKGEEIGPLPVTRFGQATRTALKDTPLQSVGNLVGAVLAGPEEAIREKNGLSKYGQWGDYYIDRMIANLAADGTITAQEAQRAMIERKGPTYDLALQQSEQEMMLRTPGTLPILALKEGAHPIEVAAAVITSLFPGGLFPTGELKLRGLQAEYNAAWKKFDAGDEEAIDKFFTDYPEYEARLALYDKPEDRLRQFMVSEIWDRYTALDKINRKRATDLLGEEFEQAFLNKETRSYDTTEIKQLATWAQMLGTQIPEVPETAEVERVSEPLDLYTGAEIKAIDDYYNERDRLHPMATAWQGVYYSLPAGAERKAFLAQHPQLKKYWDWNTEYKANHPEIQPYLNEQAEQRFTEDINDLSAPLTRQLIGYYITGKELTSGAKSELNRIWVSNGRKGATLDDYMNMLIGTMFGQ